MGIIDILLGPLMDLASKFIENDEKKAQFKADATKMLADYQKDVLAAAVSTMETDAKSEGWLTRNARPLVVIWAMVLTTGIIIDGATGDPTRLINAVHAVPDQLWNLITVGIGAYMLARTAEKVATTVIASKGNR